MQQDRTADAHPNPHSSEATERQLESAENVLLALARAIEAKDPYTEGHVERVSRSARALGERLGLPRREVDSLAESGVPPQDVGKIGVRESVLLKPGR